MQNIFGWSLVADYR